MSAAACQTAWTRGQHNTVKQQQRSPGWGVPPQRTGNPEPLAGSRPLPATQPSRPQHPPGSWRCRPAPLAEQRSLRSSALLGCAGGLLGDSSAPSSRCSTQQPHDMQRSGAVRRRGATTRQSMSMCPRARWQCAKPPLASGKLPMCRPGPFTEQSGSVPEPQTSSGRCPQPAPLLNSRPLHARSGSSSTRGAHRDARTPACQPPRMPQHPGRTPTRVPQQPGRRAAAHLPRLSSASMTSRHVTQPKVSVA
jgi:hypothetical protein